MYSNSLICQILRYINSNINEKITIEELEYRFHYNRYYIMKLFKKELNITIIDYINKIRIYNSIIQIKESNQNLLNIAYKNGFYSIEYYSEIFKKVVGIKPQIAKSYLMRRNIISESNINKLNKSINELYNLKLRINNYINNEKREINVPKVLSIFR